MRIIPGIVLALLLPVLAPTAQARTGQASPPQAVASMLVTGTITVNPDGSVRGYALDEESRLPDAVKSLLARTIPGWTFAPIEVAGKPVVARAQMSVRIIAHQVEGQQFLASVEGAVFGHDAAQAKGTCAPGQCLRYAERRPPRYPQTAIRYGVGGTVYLVQEIGRDGRVERQAVAQVNLRREGPPAMMERWREALALASTTAAREWTYEVPTSGPAAGKDHWVVRVPINFAMTLPGSDAPPHRLHDRDRWDVYLPGPRHAVPWAEDAAGTASTGSADAIPVGGGPFVPDQRFVLLTPVGAGPAGAGGDAGSG